MGLSGSGGLDLKFVLHSLCPKIPKTHSSGPLDFPANLKLQNLQVEEMLHLPQNPDTTDVHGRSPLMAASAKGHTEVLRLLLEADCSKTWQMTTALRP